MSWPDHQALILCVYVSCPGTTALEKFVSDELGHLDMDANMHSSQWGTTDRAIFTTHF